MTLCQLLDGFPSYPEQKPESYRPHIISSAICPLNAPSALLPSLALLSGFPENARCPPYEQLPVCKVTSPDHTLLQAHLLTSLSSLLDWQVFSEVLPDHLI